MKNKNNPPLKHEKEHENQAVNKQQGNARRHLLRTALGAGALAVWHKPIINSVVLLAHAQTSFCPAIVIGDPIFGPASGMNTPPLCRIVFDVLSSDAAQPLTILSITDNNTNMDTMIMYDEFGTATDQTGPRVIWQGPGSDAPFCTDLMLVTPDIEFTITLQCDASGGLQETQTVLLSTILAQAEFSAG